MSEESDLFLIVLALGRRHSSLYHVPEEGYATVGEALIWTLDYGLGKKFDATAKAAWIQVYTLLSLTMRMGRLSVQSNAETEHAVRRVIDPTNQRTGS